MKIQLTYREGTYKVDLSKPIDISIEAGKVNCFYAPNYKAEPYQSGDFIGEVKQGATVNFFNVFVNPHGNGTHTECLGHITQEQESINDELLDFHQMCYVVSVPLASREEDLIITRSALEQHLPDELPPAIAIRTRPNTEEKLSLNYSGNNPPYMDAEAMRFLVHQGVKHVLIDLPSVDREQDGGVLACHHIFWDLEDESRASSRKDCTITELIYIPDEIKDGHYFLNMMIAPIKMDASPSKPVLYRIERIRKT